jgi:sugar phosphate isomerase/epimerase
MAYPVAQAAENPTYLETLTRLAQDDFFSVLEIVWIKDPALRRSVKEIVESGHLAITYGAQAALLNQRLDLSSPIDNERRKAVDQVKACIDEASGLGAERMSLLSGFDRGESEREKLMGLLVNSVKEICAYGELRHMPITMEAFDREMEKKCLIGPAQDAATFARIIRQDYKHFGIMYDMAHGAILNEDPKRALTMLRPYLDHVHIGNCVKRTPTHPAYGDKHPRFGLEGGEHDVKELTRFLEVLFDIGYIGKKARADGRLPTVGFEIKPMPEENPEVVIAGSKRVWKQAWTQLQRRR